MLNYRQNIRNETLVYYMGNVAKKHLKQGLWSKEFTIQ